MKLAIALLCCSLAGCVNLYAGITRWTVEPFYSSDTKSYVCCRAQVTTGKSAGNVVVHIAKTGDAYTVDVTEQQVDATAPIAAAGVTASAVAGAISNTAISAAKILH